MSLLNSRQMAEFAARGILRLDGVVPDAVNRAFMQQMTQVPDEAPRQHMQRLMSSRAVPVVAPGTALDKAYAPDTPVQDMLRVPAVAGAIESLVGRQPVVDHHFLHTTFPGGKSQHLHQDSTIDPRLSFDVQLFYFPHAVDKTMGGTRYVPGTHLRIVSEMGIGRYQNMLGQQRMVCPAGTVALFHHGIWHGAGANRSSTHRYVLKIRLCPTSPQQRLWDLSDLPDDHVDQRPVFWSDPGDTPDPVQRILMTSEPWFEQDTGRLEYMNRIRLWRYLIGDPTFDVDYWMTRVENEQAVAQDGAGSGCIRRQAPAVSPRAPSSAA